MASSSPKANPEEKDNAKKKAKSTDPMASVGDVIGFVWDLGMGSRVLFVVGSISGFGNGMVYPILAWIFSNSFSKISSASSGLAQIRELSFTFMILGAFAFVMACLQTGCLEICAHRATKAFRLQWFQSLLRQDAAFFDVYDIGGKFALWPRMNHSVAAAFWN